MAGQPGPQPGTAWIHRATGGGSPTPTALPSTMRGAELSHHGGDCTFQTMLLRNEPSDLRCKRQIWPMIATTLQRWWDSTCA
jgi:hypothetical protein